MRTTIQKVRDILEPNDITDDVIESIIESASVMVTSLFSGTSTSSALLAEIERWVSAHMIASTVLRQTIDQGAGGAYEKYAGTFADGLKSTSYGQTAIALDSSGVLASSGGRQVKLLAVRQ
jgi:hypothetical protein